MADRVVDMKVAFSGFNIHSSSVIRDGGVWKIWYSGWQTQADWPNDTIYYRTSRDGINWSEPVTVMRKDHISNINVRHIGDPAVALDVNGVTGQKQYTMFYTVSEDKGTPEDSMDNQLWSSVSSDGVNWHYPKKVVDGHGAGEPTVITHPTSNGAYWQVYFGKRDPGNFHRVWLVGVNGNREAVHAPKAVHNQPLGATIGHPEVEIVNGKFVLWYNVYLPPGQTPFRYDIWIGESGNHEHWPTSRSLIENTSGKPLAQCATISPAAVAAPPDAGYDYDLFFGNANAMADGVCALHESRYMARWSWQL